MSSLKEIMKLHEISEDTSMGEDEILYMHIEYLEGKEQMSDEIRSVFAVRNEKGEYIGGRTLKSAKMYQTRGPAQAAANWSNKCAKRITYKVIEFELVEKPATIDTAPLIV